VNIIFYKRLFLVVLTTVDDSRKTFFKKRTNN